MGGMCSLWCVLINGNHGLDLMTWKLFEVRWLPGEKESTGHDIKD